MDDDEFFLIKNMPKSKIKNLVKTNFKNFYHLFILVSVEEHVILFEKLFVTIKEQCTYSKSVDPPGVANVVDNGVGANGVAGEVVDHFGRNWYNRK